jgi:hypothetical protein
MKHHGGYRMGRWLAHQDALGFTRWKSNPAATTRNNLGFAHPQADSGMAFAVPQDDYRSQEIGCSIHN